MSNTIVAKRYASALFQIAQENNVISQVEEELRVVRELLENSDEVKAVLNSSKLTKENKKEILRNAFASVNVFVLNTLLLLVDRHRVNEVSEVVSQYIELANEANGLAEAKVYSIRPLTDSEREAISSTFAAKVGKKSLQIENIVDSELLGGIVLRIGSRIYDGSLRGKLNRLERKLLT